VEILGNIFTVASRLSLSFCLHQKIAEKFLILLFAPKNCRKIIAIQEKIEKPVNVLAIPQMFCPYGS